MKPADVTKFTLAGTSELANYDPKLWDGFKCTNCGNEAAMGKEDAPEHVAGREAIGNPIDGSWGVARPDSPEAQDWEEDRQRGRLDD